MQNLQGNRLHKHFIKLTVHVACAAYLCLITNVCFINVCTYDRNWLETWFNYKLVMRLLENNFHPNSYNLAAISLPKISQSFCMFKIYASYFPLFNHSCDSTSGTSAPLCWPSGMKKQNKTKHQVLEKPTCME